MATVKCIYGPPCSGKSTFVNENMNPETDLVWDFDEIKCALTKKAAHEPISDAQNDMCCWLRASFATVAADSKTDVVWFICTKPNENIKELLGKDTEYIEMDATEDECLERLMQDDSREDKEFFKRLIHEYFQNGSEEGRCKVMNKECEVRNFLNAVEIRKKDDSDKLFLAGVPIVFNKKTDISGLWEESIDPEAVDEDTLKDVRFLVNHDFNMIPLARSRRNTKNSTMRLSIEEDGVHMEADLDEKNPKALELNSAVERGDVSGMSFAFLVDGDKWEDLDSDYPKRTITHIAEIFEVSAVTWPAYEQTSISARSLESGKASLEEARAALDNARKRSERIAELNSRLEEI
jgi:hypothetical protein